MIDNFNVLFATKNEGMVGSLYFSWGRIRLKHEDGPYIEEHASIDRMTMTEDNIAAFEAWAFVGDTWEETPEFAELDHAQRVAKLKSLGAVNAVPDAENRLVEICDGGYHVSRGNPCSLDLSVEEAYDLYDKVISCIKKHPTAEDRNESLVKHIIKHGMDEKLGYEKEKE